MRTADRVVGKLVQNADGHAVELPGISEAARQAGVVADELITLGGNCGASKIGSDQPLLGTTLLDLPAEQLVLLYEHRWQVELFFRFPKHFLASVANLQS